VQVCDRRYHLSRVKPRPLKPEEETSRGLSLVSAAAEVVEEVATLYGEEKRGEERRREEKRGEERRRAEKRGEEVRREEKR
jgi:hypothetical protein